MFSTHLMQINRKKLVLIPLLVAAIVLPFTAEKTTVDSAVKAPIIYEYQLITQEKDEDLESALKEAGVSAANIAILNELPIYRTDEVDRDFRVIFQINGEQRTVKEVKMTYENRMANFVLVEEAGDQHFVSQASQIPDSFIRNAAAANAEIVFNDELANVDNLSTTDVDPSSTIDDKEDADAVVIPPEALLMEQQALSQSGRDAKSTQVDVDGEINDDTSSDTGNDISNDTGDEVTAAQQPDNDFGDGLTVAPIIVDAVFVEDTPNDTAGDTTTSKTRASAAQPSATEPKVVTKPEQPQNTDLLKANEALFALQVTQNKKQTLENALAPVKLSATQQQIINTGDFMRSALSPRQLTVYFAGNKKYKLLRGLRITRGSNYVSYVVSKHRDQYRLKNVKVVDADLRALAEKRFKHANLYRLNPQPSTAVAKTRKKTQRRGHVIDSGRYRVLRIPQKRGQSLSSALRAFSLSSAQKRLINALPVSKRAKSTRYFNVLFEKRGRSKYLRAVRVTRGGRASEYVLTKYQGKWLWADSSGKVRLASKRSQRRGSGGGFLRYPLNFSRISSGFNPYRRHPITGRVRPHRGTDFKAAHGTPIWAPAAGVVVFSGRQRGYGITLIIDHGNGYKTKYAHLSRIMPSARRGRRVHKRQIVARVGNTGVSTGAHLHYEVLVNGRARNPLTVRLPRSGGASPRVANRRQSKTLQTAKRDAYKFLPQLRRMAR